MRVRIRRGIAFGALTALLTACIPKLGSTNKQLATGERPMVVAVEDLATYRPGLNPHWELLRITRGTTEDGSTTLVYDYNYQQKSPLDIWTSTTIFSMGTEKQAKDAYLALMATSADAAAELGAHTGSRDLLVWGDESACGALLKGERPVGDLCGFRKGKRVLVFFATGDSWSASGELDDILRPKLAALESWTP